MVYGEQVLSRCSEASRHRRPAVAGGPTSVLEEAMSKLLYKPLAVLASVLGNALAGAVFKKAWKIATREDEPPQVTGTRGTWKEVLLAAALRGAIFGVITAAVSRGVEQGIRGLRPSESDEEPQEAA
jgi:hypothetical protein